MSKELADSLEESKYQGHTDHALLDEAIAALRSEPVAWTASLDEVRDNILNGRGPLESVLNNDQTNAVLSVFDELYAAPSRETAKPEAEPEFLIPGPPQSERPTFGEDKEWDSRRSAAHEPFVKRAAEPALSAEQIEVMRVLLIKVGLNPALCDTALSSLTAQELNLKQTLKIYNEGYTNGKQDTKDEGIEAAAKLADANGALQIRWFAEDIRKLKGQP